MNGQADASNDGVLESSVMEVIRSSLVNLHTMLPAKIVTFDSSNQTASVQLLINRNLNGSSLIPIPVLQDLPVIFPRAGGFAITFPVSVGDPCAVLFCERSIDKWWTYGVPLDPEEPRLHDLSDGVVLLGLHSSLEVLSDFNSSDIEVRSIDGVNKLSITPNGDMKFENLLANFTLSALGQLIFETVAGTFTIQPAGTISFEGVSEELMAIIDELFDVLDGLTVDHLGSQPLTSSSKNELSALRVRFNTLRNFP